MSRNKISPYGRDDKTGVIPTAGRDLAAAIEIYLDIASPANALLGQSLFFRHFLLGAKQKKVARAPGAEHSGISVTID